MKALSSADMTKRLSVANLFVSLRDHQDVGNVLKKSRVVGWLLTELLNGSISVEQDIPSLYRVTLETMSEAKKQLINGQDKPWTVTSSFRAFR